MVSVRKANGCGARRASEPRDQSRSSFTATLERLCESAGVVGAVIVDRGGETVDYAGRVAPFDIRVAAAEWRIILARFEACERSELRGTREVYLRGSQKSFGAMLLPEGYALVFQLLPHCFTASPRALSEAVREICLEAGLPLAHGLAQWSRVQVDEAPGRQRRPRSVWVGRKWVPVEVLGRCVGSELNPKEVGYRVRLVGGLELTLVREPLSQWFADPGTSLAGSASVPR